MRTLKEIEAETFPAQPWLQLWYWAMMDGMEENWDELIDNFSITEEDRKFLGRHADIAEFVIYKNPELWTLPEWFSMSVCVSHHNDLIE